MHSGVVFGQQIAKELGDEALLLEQHGRWPPRFHLLSNLGPHLMEIGEVADDVLFGSTASRGPDDDAAGKPVLLAELADDAAEAGALLARIDFAGHTDMVDRRHEDQKAPRHRHVRGQPGALGAQRLFDDLNQDLLPFLQQVFDLRLRPVIARLRA
jgi:hypothetical protein